MPMTGSPYAVRADLADCHRALRRHVASPGTWLSGAERIAIAEEVRRARGCALCRERKAAVSPFAVDGEHDASGALPTSWTDVVHRLVTDPGRLTRSWLEAMLGDELDAHRYVELVAVTVVGNALDVFDRALGAAPAPLPEAVPGEPTRAAHDFATDDCAWVPMVPDAASGGGDAAREIYSGLESVPNIGRALSLVPAEVAVLHRLSEPHYMALGHVADPHYETPGRAIDRLQMELVASRVSLMNECFY